MLEIGKTYRQRGFGTRDVDIVGSGSQCLDYSRDGGRYEGQFFVGIVRASHTEGDRIAAFTPAGKFLYDYGTDFTRDPDDDLIVPQRYVNLNDALSLIRSRCQGTSFPFRDLIIGDLECMPFKELTDA